MLCEDDLGLTAFPASTCRAKLADDTAIDERGGEVWTAHPPAADRLEPAEWIQDAEIVQFAAV